MLKLQLLKDSLWLRVAEGFLKAFFFLKNSSPYTTPGLLTKHKLERRGFKTSTAGVENCNEVWGSREIGAI